MDEDGTVLGGEHFGDSCIHRCLCDWQDCLPAVRIPVCGRIQAYKEHQTVYGESACLRGVVYRSV